MNRGHSRGTTRLAAAAILLGLCLAAAPAAAQEFISAFGTPGSGDGQFNMPRDVAVDLPNASNLVVADGGNNRIQVFKSNGDFLFAFGSPGSAPGLFDQPTGVAIDTSNGSRIVVADELNNRIQIFSSFGVPMNQFGVEGSGTEPTQFIQPFAVAVDLPNASNIVVADFGNNRIQVFTLNGTFIRTFGSVGTGPGQLEGPTGVAIDTANNSNVVVAEQNGARVSVFDSNGNFIRTFGQGILRRPVRVAVDLAHNSNVLVPDQGGDGRIWVFTATGEPLGAIGTPGAGPGQLDGPAGLALDPANNDNVVIADLQNNRIEIFGSGFIAVPTLGTAALALSGLLLAGLGYRRLRRRAA